VDIPLDEVIYFDCITSTPSTSAAVDADSTPTFAVYEESTDTDIGVGGNLTKRTSLTGNYRGTFTLSAANGFEVGKWYSIIGSAVVGGVTGKAVLKNFRVVLAESVAGEPKVDVGALGGVAQSLTDLKDFADDGYDPSTNKVQGVVLTDTLTTYTGDTPQTGDSYAIVNSGTYGNSAIKTLENTIASYIDTEIGTIVTQTGAAAIRSAVGLASANLDTQLSGIPAAVLAATVDGITVSKALEVVLAILAGVAVPSGSTVAFKKRGGMTTTITST